MKNAVHGSVRYTGRQMSHLSVETKLDSFFKPALLGPKTSAASAR
jgi:hypothetical protein